MGTRRRLQPHPPPPHLPQAAASARPWQREWGLYTDSSSLAAYGIDPSTAVAEEAPEDGGVEEEGGEDDSDSDSDDDVDLVFSGGGQRVLDLR